MYITKTLILVFALISWLATVKSETCPEGMGGNKCLLCLDDAACVQASGDPDAVCSTDVEFAPDNLVKAFSCVASNPAVGSFIKADSLYAMCETAPANGTASTAAECAFGLNLVQAFGGGELRCASSACTVTEGSASVTCPWVLCDCEPKGCQSPVLVQLVGAIKGASMECDEEGSCVVILEGLPIGGGRLAAQCTVASCLGQIE